MCQELNVAAGPAPALVVVIGVFELNSIEFVLQMERKTNSLFAISNDNF